MKTIVLLICLLLLTCCKSYDFIGSKYVADNKEKVVSIEFINDTLCKINQKFLCDDLPDSYRNTSFKATYQVDKVNIKTYDENLNPKRFKADVLIINNLDCQNCEEYTLIPNYIASNYTDTELPDKRLKDKIKFGVIYNMLNDTLVLDDNRILFDNLKLKKQ